jgi:DNA modification methylase
LDYNSKHELIVYGWRGKHNFYGKNEQSVWEIDKPLKSDLHPTMKPVELIVKAILNSSKKDDIVLDLFGGSGSTLIACEQTNRVCYMMEIDPLYCDVIRKRYANFIGKKDQWETITPKI